jgi:hypothetical protein
MNTKTPIILLVLLVLAGGYWFFTRDKEESTKPQEHKLIDLASSDVNSVTITPSEGKQIVLKKTGSDWRMTQPVDAPADNDQVTGLIDGIINLKSTNEVDSASGTGLDKPQYKVDLAGAKSASVSFGNKLSIGGGVYSQVQGSSTVEVVPADVLTKLDQAATSYRQTKLVMTPSLSISEVTINKKAGTVALQKHGEDWQITSPQKLDADTPAVTDLLTALTGLKATSFVDDPSEAADAMKGNPPISSVSFMAPPVSAPGATTQPSTKPVMTTINFGAYDDVLKKHIYAKVEGSPFIAKVDVASITALEKSPLDLRDKKVMDIDPEQVSRFLITTTLAKEPSAKGAEVVVERRKGSGGKGVPFAATAPASAPTTGSATQPSVADKLQLPNSKPPSPWVLGNGDDADGSDVNDFLGALHPLRVDRYLEINPTTQPTTQFVVKIHTEAAGGAGSADHELRLIDRGNEQPYIGSYNNLTFEISRFTLSKFLQGDFKPKPPGTPGSPAAAPIPGLQ